MNEAATTLTRAGTERQREATRNRVHHTQEVRPGGRTVNERRADDHRLKSR